MRATAVRRLTTSATRSKPRVSVKPSSRSAASARTSPTTTSSSAPRCSSTTSLGSKEADPANPEQPPPWPINYTIPKADVPSHLRREENRCRRANIVDFTAEVHDRPYTLSREGRKNPSPRLPRASFRGGARSGGRSGDDRRGGAGGEAGGDRRGGDRRLRGVQRVEHGGRETRLERERLRE